VHTASAMSGGRYSCVVMLAQLILLEWQAALLDLLVGRSELQDASVDGF